MMGRKGNQAKIPELWLEECWCSHQHEAAKPRSVGVASRWLWKSPLFSLTAIGLTALTLVSVGGLLSPMNCVEQRLGNIRAEKAGTIIVAVQFSEA